MYNDERENYEWAVPVLTRNDYFSRINRESKPPCFKYLYPERGTRDWGPFPTLH